MSIRKKLSYRVPTVVPVSLLVIALSVVLAVFYVNNTDRFPVFVRA